MAVTAAVMDESAPTAHVELVVDRPFLFYIRDRSTKTPLSWGRVVDGESLQEWVCSRSRARSVVIVLEFDVAAKNSASRRWPRDGQVAPGQS